MPKEEKGVLTKRLESLLGKGFSKIVKLKGFWKKASDIGLPRIIGLIDDNLGEKIPDPYKTEIRESLDKAIMEKDFDTAIGYSMELADKFIDVPGLSDPEEKQLFHGLGNLVSALIMALKKDGMDLG